MTLIHFMSRIACNRASGNKLVLKVAKTLCNVLELYKFNPEVDEEVEAVAKNVVSKEFAEFIFREIMDKSAEVFDYTEITKDEVNVLTGFIKGEYDEYLDIKTGYNENESFMENARLVMSYQLREIADNEEIVDDEEDTDIFEDSNDEAEDIVEEESEEDEEVEETIAEYKEADISKWETMIDASVRGVMSTYKDMYASGFELEKPLGILTDTGYIDEFISSKEDMTLTGFMSEVTKMMGVQLVASNKTVVSVEDVNSGVNYLPVLQAEIAMGIRNGERVKYWKEYSEYLENRVRGIYYSIYKSNPKLTLKEANEINNRVENILTNSILIVEFNMKSTAKFKMHFDRKYTDRITKDSMTRALENGLFSKYGKVRLVNYTGSCRRVNILFDEAIDGAKPLFAYKVYEYYRDQGIKPDWSRVILGKNLSNDEIFTLDFASNVNFNTFIGAGPRSGKGVMTLNILASAISLGMPIFYADCKPEMSKSVQSLAQKHGSNYVSIDSNSGIERDIRLATGVPRELPIYKQIGGYITYCKLMQIMTVISELRAAGIELNSVDRNERLLFILDETKAMFDIVDSMDSTIKSLNGKDSPYSDEVKEYVTKIINWGNSVSGTITSSLVSSLPKSKINLITLAQKLNIGDWDDTGLKLKVPFSGMVKSPTINKLVGNGSSGMTMGFKASAPNSELANTYINSSYRCFGNYGSIKAPEDNAVMTVFKPYLVLPSVDMNTSLGVESFGELQRSYSKIGDVNDLFNEDGSPIEGIALEGIVDIIGDSDALVKKSFGQAYDVAYEILDKAGLLDKYSDKEYGRKVLAYLYDGDVNTLKSVGEILSSFEEENGSEFEGELGYRIDDGLENSKNKNEQNLNENSGKPEGKNRGAVSEDLSEPEKKSDKVEIKDDWSHNIISDESFYNSHVKREVQEENFECPDDSAYDFESDDNFEKFLNSGVEDSKDKNFNGRYTDEFPEVDGDVKDTREGVKCEKVGSSKYVNPGKENVEVIRGFKKFIANRSSNPRILALETTKILCKQIICNDVSGIPRSMIKRIEIYEDTLVVNGKEVVLNHIVPYDKGLQLCDVLEYEYLIGYFKGLKTLTLAKEIVCDVCDSIGIDRIVDIFGVYKNINSIKLVSNGRPELVLDRDELLMKSSTEKDKVKAAEAMDKYAKAKKAARSKNRKKRFSKQSESIGQKLGYGVIYVGTSIVSKVKGFINSFKE